MKRSSGRRWRSMLVGALALTLLVGGGASAVAGDKKKHPNKPRLPEGYAFNVIAENVPEPLGSEHESVEIYKRASLELAMEWGTKFIYDDRCAPRVSSGETERLIAAGKPVPTEVPPPPATKVFDNIYYLGLNDVASWALVERNGKEIYIFDALNTPEEARTYIDGGLRNLGFNPANIKAVFIMHGHRDHWGGSKYLQDTYGATIYAGAADWPIITGPTAPARGVDTPIGPMKLGRTEVTFYDTPGHTNGTISALIPTKFNGKRHLVAFWGGTGYPRNSDAQLELYIDSITDFTMAVRRAGADILMSNHSHTDATVERFPTIDFKRNKTDMIWGPEYVTDTFDQINFCARAQLARQQLPNWPFTVYGGGAWPPATSPVP